MRTVMIVDDYAVFRKRISRFSIWNQEMGFVIAGEAGNGKQALELLEAQAVDVILTDIKMPLMDGLALLKEVKMRALCPCVVLLSEYSDFQYAREGLVLGAFDYLVKPVEEGNLQQIFSRITEFLDHREREKGNANETALLTERLAQLSSEAPNLSRKILEQIYRHQGENQISTALAATKIVEGIFMLLMRRFPWLRHYIDPRAFSEQTLSFTTWSELRFSFEQTVRDLLGTLRQLYLPVDDTIIKKSMDYILDHPESDLGLNAVAEKLYVIIG